MKKLVLGLRSGATVVSITLMGLSLHAAGLEKPMRAAKPRAQTKLDFKRTEKKSGLDFDKSAPLILDRKATVLPNTETGKNPLVATDALKPKVGKEKKPIVMTPDKEPVTLAKLDNTPYVQKTAGPKAYALGILNLYENEYGPLRMKAHSIGLSDEAWQARKAEFLKAVGKAKTDGEVYYLAANLLYGFTDAHVAATLPSNLQFELPLQMSAADGKIVVNETAGDFPSNVRKPKLGDVLTAINGEPVEKFQARYPLFQAGGHADTSLFLFARGLGKLREARGFPLSQLNWNDVKLTFAPLEVKGDGSSSTGTPYDITLKFKKTGIGLVQKSNDPKVPAPAPIVAPAPPMPDREPPQVVPMDRQLESIYQTILKVGRAQSLLASDFGGIEPEKKDPREVGRVLNLGEAQPFFQLPKDFKQITPKFITNLPETNLFGATPRNMPTPDLFKVMMNSDTMMAGTFMKDGKRVGYLRIGSYEPSQVGTMLVSLNYYISQLKNTDYLVYDQTSNPGGMVAFSDMVIRALIGKIDPAKHIKFAIKPTPDLQRSFLDLMNLLKTFPEDKGTPAAQKMDEIYKGLNESYEKISNALRDGKNLTEPLSMVPLSQFFEAVVKYNFLENTPVPPELLNKALGTNVMRDVTYPDVVNGRVVPKPVYVLTSHDDFSGADFTPAASRFYGFKTVGEHTAGAGGMVIDTQVNGYGELGVRVTNSLMVDPKGGLVENYGVPADIPVPRLPSDYANQGATYFSRVMNAIAADQAKNQKAPW